MSAILSSRLAGSLVLAAALLAACAAPKPTIRTNYDKSANLAAYHTYGFVSEPGTNRAGYSTLVTKQFEEAIQREMDARGYRYSETDPDLLVNFSASSQEKVDVQSTSTPGGYYGYRRGLYTAGGVYSGTEVDTVRYKVGTANIDVVDARKKQLLWEGVAEGKLTKEVMADPGAAINSVVTQMFAQFPGRAT